MSCCIVNEPQILTTCYTNVPFVRDCGDEEELWQADNGVMNPSGTFIITLDESCNDAANLFVNGTQVSGVTLLIGETRAFTFDPLESIGIQCGSSGDMGCKATLTLFLNYERNLV